MNPRIIGHFETPQGGEAGQQQAESEGVICWSKNSIFRGMNIHLPAILMFTRGTRF
jgi:hypothetical protein